MPHQVVDDQQRVRAQTAPLERGQHLGRQALRR
jgi:hypothetical protein